MAEGFICGRGRGGKLGPLELFVDGYGIENWAAEGSNASLSKTLKVNLPSGETQDSVIYSKPINLSGISKVQLMLSLQYESTPERYAYGAIVYIKPADGGDPVSYHYAKGSGARLAELSAPTGNCIICIATEYARTGGCCPTVEVSRVSLIPQNNTAT